MAGDHPRNGKNCGNSLSPDEGILTPVSKISYPLGGLKQSKMVPSTLSLWLDRFGLCGLLGIVRLTKMCGAIELLKDQKPVFMPGFS